MVMSSTLPTQRLILSQSSIGEGSEYSENIRLPQVPLDVEVGADGRLYCPHKLLVNPIDPVTGGKVGPDFTVYVYSGELVISPKKDRL